MNTSGCAIDLDNIETIDQLNLSKALSIGKLPFKITKGNRTRYTLGPDLEQCKARFVGWNVCQVPVEEYINNKISVL